MADFDFSQFHDEDKGFPSKSEVSSYLDKKFGPGKWSISSGYRPESKENKLREEGAGTVPKGEISAHSTGTEDRPGAWDLSVQGMTPKQVSDMLHGAKLSSGAKLSVDYPEGTHGKEGAHAHIGFSTEDIPKAAAPEKDFDFSQFHDVAPEKPKTTAQKAGDAYKTGVKSSFDKLKADLTAPGPKHLLDFSPQKALLSLPGDAVGLGLSALGVTQANSAVEKATRGPSIPEGKFLGVTIPGREGRGLDILGATAGLGAPEARLAGVAGIPAAQAAAAPTNALRAAVKVAPESAAHAADIKLLHDNGINMTPGQIKGGTAKAVEEKQQSAPFRGPAIKDAVDNSVSDFNRAMYGKATKLIGEDYPKDGPVGEKAIDQLFEKGEQKYEAIKPKIKLQADKALEGDYATALESVGPAALPERADLQHIIDTRVKPAFKDGVMDGQSFKDTESFLTKQSKALRLGTAYQQREADAIDDVLSSLRNNAETHSPPEVSKDLKALNSYWASINRLSDAAYAAKAQGGRFTPNQMLTAAGKGGRYQRRMVARGKAFDQDLISAAQRVLPNKIPNSGTTDRALANKGPLSLAGAGMGATAGYHMAGAEGAGVGGILGGLAGHAADAAVAPTANTLARAALQRSAAKQLVRQGVTRPQNTLQGVMRPGIGAAALSAPTGGTQTAP